MWKISKWRTLVGFRFHESKGFEAKLDDCKKDESVQENHLS